VCEHRYGCQPSSHQSPSPNPPSPREASKGRRSSVLHVEQLADQVLGALASGNLQRSRFAHSTRKAWPPPPFGQGRKGARRTHRTGGTQISEEMSGSPITNVKEASDGQRTTSQTYHLRKSAGFSTNDCRAATTTASHNHCQSRSRLFQSARRSRKQSRPIPKVFE
jgi:hypothetical protein